VNGRRGWLVVLATATLVDASLVATGSQSMTQAWRDARTRRGSVVLLGVIVCLVAHLEDWAWFRPIDPLGALGARLRSPAGGRCAASCARPPAGRS
jgi:hypothetical protein